MIIEVGDLVRVRGDDWIGKPLGIVTEIKNLVHDQSGVKYTVVTAAIGGTYFTFTDESFELIGKTERKKK